MNVLDWILGKNDTKEVKESKIFATITNTRSAILTEQNYEAYSREGYLLNPYVFACIDKIAKAVNSIEWELYVVDKDGDEQEVRVHPILDLLQNPNPYQSFNDLIESYVCYFALDGNTFTEKVKDGTKKTKELYSLRPDKVDIIFNTNASTRSVSPVSGYEYKMGSIVPFLFEDIIHAKNFNPLDMNGSLGKGQPLMSAVASSGDQNNASRRHNISLLQNSATPSGILEVNKESAGWMDEDKVEALKSRFRDKYQGVDKAGEPIVVQYVSWKQMGMSNKDLDWEKGIQQSAREICEGLGVPSILVGDPASKTFNNYKEAKKGLYIDTAIPLAMKIVRSFNQGLVRPEYGKQFKLKLNLDSIDVIREERMSLWDHVSKATFLTENEKRETVGFGTKEGLDIYRIPSNLIDIPENGIIDIDAIAEEIKKKRF